MKDLSQLQLTAADTRALSLLLDRAAITQVVQDWGLARDAGRWDLLESLYTLDATMHTTWFVGSASDFVERKGSASATFHRCGMHRCPRRQGHRRDADDASGARPA